MDSKIDDILKRARVVAKARSQGWDKARMAREAGIGVSTLTGLEDDSFNPTAETLRKLETVVLRAEAELAVDS